MQVVYARCAGLDVHQKTVSACASVCEADGKKRRQVRVFGTRSSPPPRTAALPGPPPPGTPETPSNSQLLPCNNGLITWKLLLRSNA
jgi:hypothetical protein